MPFDSTNYTTSEPFTLEHFAEWLATHNPEGPYDWSCVRGGCLIGIYGLAMGLHDACKGKFRYEGSFQELHAKVFLEGWLCVASPVPHTFGAALDRALKLLAGK